MDDNVKLITAIIISGTISNHFESSPRINLEIDGATSKASQAQFTLEVF
jgi:hypothetical protein